MNLILRSGFAPIVILALAGCSSAGKDAEREYDIVVAKEPEAISEHLARCAAAQKVEQGYLKDQNKEEYERWRLRASIYCMNAGWRAEGLVR